jgi:hypothetical protein
MIQNHRIRTTSSFIGTTLSGMLHIAGFVNLIKVNNICSGLIPPLFNYRSLYSLKFSKNLQDWIQYRMYRCLNFTCMLSGTKMVFSSPVFLSYLFIQIHILSAKLNVSATSQLSDKVVFLPIFLILQLRMLFYVIISLIGPLTPLGFSYNERFGTVSIIFHKANTRSWYFVTTAQLYFPISRAARQLWLALELKNIAVLNRF